MKVGEIADIIDSTWHYSWYWEKDNNCYLTLRGLQQAKEDGQHLLAALQSECKEIENALIKIEGEIKKYEE